ncbi:MopE-related protein [Maribacter sp. MAR_2009_72]|uniref:MopE-related protein n=1 Tax=Maribacter sp. MAR_2009_72 TaxID=1250050 RepID=UPI00119A0B4B|nr:MopE-related protein [Maribacter sp. MAR_2009_72]TVZ13862.1 putative secreted protein (Por secretion system target) [Maribacter sp. MAR_2009_72]
MGRIRISTLWIFILFINFQFLTAQNKSVEGEWSNPIQFGIVPVAVANLPNGNLITWSSQFRDTFVVEGDGTTFTELFDPKGGIDGNGAALGSFTSNTDHDMFCPGINNLADGRILSAGGTSSEKTSIYDWRTNSWTVADQMNIPRGYQGNVTLKDGSVFTIGGSWSGGFYGNRNAERYSTLTGWQKLSNVHGEDIFVGADYAEENQGNYRIDNHVWLWPAPNGKLFHAGPSEMMHWIDVDVPGGSIIEAGIRQDVNQNIRDYYSMKGNTVMFDKGKILKTGGAGAYGDDDIGTVPARDNSFIIDLNGIGFGDMPNVSFVGNMSRPRTMHNSTVLPNGEVLITGGLEYAAVFTDVTAVKGAEIFNENTGWRSVAAMQIPRTYHSVAILMVDGRVFVGGGGLCDSTEDCVNHMDAEIYSPPYLFNPDNTLAERPEIINGPESSGYDSTINIEATPGIQQFSLIRFSAATHSTNNEQRRIPVDFTANGNIYDIEIPERELLPPGYYMLFGINANGVPSIAHTIQIGSEAPIIYNPNLVLDMQFDGSDQDLNALDNSQYGHHGTIVQRDNDGDVVQPNQFSWSDGIIGNAIEFDGLEFNSNSLLEIDYSDELASTTNSITISAWVYRNSNSGIPEANGKIANVGIFSHDYPQLFFGFHNTLYKWAFNANSPLDCYAGYAPLDTWVHLAATYDGNTAILYANGVEVCNRKVSGLIDMNNNGLRQSKYTVSGFYDHRYDPDDPSNPSASDIDGIPDYGNTSGITDEISGKIDLLKVYNKVLEPAEIRAMYQEGLNTNNPNITICEGNYLTAQYKIGVNGTWITSNVVTVPLGSEVFIRPTPEYTGEYILTTPQYDGPTYSNLQDADKFTEENAYQIDTFVTPDFGLAPWNNPDRNNGLVDTSNEGQFVLTTPAGCPTTIYFNLVQENSEEGCPGYLPNGDSSIFITSGVLNTGLDEANGTNIETNGSECALQIVNNDINEPFARFTISVNLNQFGIQTGDEISIELDGKGEVSPRYEIRQNNTNSRPPLISGNFSQNWSTIKSSFVIPENTQTFDIWLFSNYAANSPGIAYFDNLKIINLTATGGNHPPTANFTASPIIGNAPLNVVFDSSTSYDSDILDGIDNYIWRFGDQTTSNVPNPSHIYEVPGVYLVSLTVYDYNGLKDEKTAYITVNGSNNNSGPTAIISADKVSGIAPLNVQFTGSNSTDDIGVATYAWNFGDGTTSSVANPQHTFSSVGNFEVFLTVTDDSGLTDTKSLYVNVEEDNIDESCPSGLTNDAAGLSLPLGDFVGGVDAVNGTDTVTNGSACGIEVVNVDPGQPWGHYRLTIRLSDYGISAGDELFIGLDGMDGSGAARLEVNRNDSPNNSLASFSYGPTWGRYESTFTVPSGISTIDLWMFSNYAIGSAGTAYYDNLEVINLSATPPCGGDGYQRYYADTDGDGYGDPENWVEDCDAPEGYVSDGTDCDDGEALSYPGNTEVCDGIDNDCDGEVDEGFSLTSYYLDADGDGYGDPGSSVEACDAPEGYVPDGTDCDDGEALSYPGNTEVCDGIDNDCDGEVDEGFSLTAYYLDADGDGYGDPGSPVEACDAPEGYVLDGTDCDDGEALSYLGNTEVCDGIDNDCDGEVDEGLDCFVECPSGLTNDAAGLSLPLGDFVGGVDAVNGTDTVTNGSACGIEVVNVDPGQPWGHYRLTIRLSDHGISAGDELFIGLDGMDGSGAARLEVNRDDSPNNSLASFSYGPTWGRYESTFTVPSGISTIDLWMFSNYAIGSAGTAYYDNLEVINLSATPPCGGDGYQRYYADTDGDGYGDPENWVEDCDAPEGYVPDGTDCDDGEALSYPGNTEVCDGIDNDCDGEVDEGFSLTSYYLDADGDGYGDPGSSVEACDAPEGYVPDGTDCDDGEALSYPGNTEVCDGIDNDCDGEVDEGFSLTAYYLDADGDGYGDPGSPVEACDAPEGYVLDGTDCDDGEALSYLGNTEVCDGIDNDCDGEVDEGLDCFVECPSGLTNDAAGLSLPLGDFVGGVDAVNGTDTVTNGSACGIEVVNVDPGQPWGHYRLTIRLSDHGISAGDELFIGLDGMDGSGAARLEVNRDDSPNNSLASFSYGPTWGRYESTFTVPSGISTIDLWMFSNYAIGSAGTAYYDNLEVINLSATPPCGGDGYQRYYADTDGDGYGDPENWVEDCDAPEGYVPDGTDCDDGEALSYPGNTEVCDGIDNDCDGEVDEGFSLTSYYLDADGDGYGDPGSSVEACDAPEGYVPDGTDCDDGEALSYPGNTEVCDGIDNDCDGEVDEGFSLTAYYLDADGDGYGDPGSPVEACDAPEGYVLDGTDCDDGEALSYPGNTEVCDGIDNDCDGEVDEGLDCFVECPSGLTNDAAGLSLPLGDFVGGVDAVNGTDTVTNGSACGIEVVNVDPGQPWGHYRLTIRLSDHGISAGDELFIGLDGMDGSGAARLEVNRDDSPNNSLASFSYGPTWGRYESTFTVPSGISTIDLWMFSNYAIGSAGTAYYDNLEVINLSGNSATSKSLQRNDNVFTEYTQNNVEEESHKMIISPNPVSDLLTVNFNDDIKVDSIEIYDTLGRLLKAINVLDNESVKIDVSQYNSGTYYIIANSLSGTRLQKRVLIKRE